MIEKIQRFHSAIGKAGCYALACVQAAYPNIKSGEALDIILDAIGKKYIYLNIENMADPENMRVDDAAALICLTRREPLQAWTRRRELPGYKPRPGELVIERWVSPTNNHFIVREGTRAWDPYGNSVTVKTGKLESYRIFARAC